MTFVSSRAPGVISMWRGLALAATDYLYAQALVRAQSRIAAAAPFADVGPNSAVSSRSLFISIIVATYSS
jgi:hypothetical protein